MFPAAAGFRFQKGGSRLDETLCVDFRENLITQADRCVGKGNHFAGAYGVRLPSTAHIEAVTRNVSVR